MSWLKLGATAALGAAAWYWLSQPGDPVSADAKQYLQAITQGLDRELSSQRMCLHEGPFPLDTSARHLPCLRCEDLHAAGLLDRTPSPNTTAEQPQWQYDLTDLGRQLYTTDEDPVSGDRSPRLCLARTKVHHVVAAQPALRLGGNIAIGLDYVAELIDPHPFTFDPRSQPLDLPVPTQQTPALLPPERTTVMLTPWGSFLETDASFRYGKHAKD